MLSIQQAAARLGMGQSQLRALITAGRIKTIERPVTCLGIEQAEVERAIATKQATGHWPGAKPVGRPTKTTTEELDGWGDFNENRLSPQQFVAKSGIDMVHVEGLVSMGWIPVVYSHNCKRAIPADFELPEALKQMARGEWDRFA